MAAVSAKGISKVIFSSSLGTLIEWYDFYIFGMLAKTISIQFFPEGNDTAALLSTLAIFAAGFLVRPFGALVFGRLGDLIGRKSTFLLTLVLMGSSTFLIGLVPGYKTIGIAAPLLVLFLRLIQGLALGGEYGGAATYVAEHSPAGKRGYYTAWIQTTATLGLFVALGIIMAVKSNMSDAAFTAEWGGWRYPFWISILLVGVSVYIRLKMNESPLFYKLLKEGKTSVNPLKESFGHKANFKMVLLALFGAVMGQGVIWYTGQFYAQSFLENTVKIEFMQNREILLWGIALATPFFVFFGWLSDKIGRKWIMLTGMLLGVIFYRPIFGTMLKEGKTSVNPLKESFGHKANFKMVLLALFGAVMGQGVIWYTGQFYAQSFLENTVKIEFMQNREILLWGIALATPFFVFFGWLSDKIGRKWIMLTGMLLGVIFYRPIFGTMLKDADAKEWKKQVNSKSDTLFKNSIIKIDTIKTGTNFSIIYHRKTPITYDDGKKFSEIKADTLVSSNGFSSFIKEDTKPVYIDKILSSSLKWKFILLIWVMIIFVTMVYGPVAAFLVELFPTKIRYTSMSLPYHIGNGVFGGLVPFIATLLSTTFANDPLVGLWYPIGVAALCFVIGLLYLNNKVDKNIKD